MTPNEIQDRVMEILEEHGDFDYAEVGLVSPTGESWYKEIWYNEDRTGVETDIGNESISLINYLERTKKKVVSVSTERLTVKTTNI